MMDVKTYIDRFDTLRSERAVWDTLFQDVGKYVAHSRQNFTMQPTEGQRLNNMLYASTALFAAKNASAAILGMLWPGSARQTIEIVAPDDVEITAELQRFYDDATDQTARDMDDPRAGLLLSLVEYMEDQMIFGTSGIGAERGDETKYIFKPYGVKEMYIDEGRAGRVDSIHLFYEWPVRRVVKEYGLENVSAKVREAYKSGSREKVKVLVCIGERDKPKAEKGVLAMPIESMHIEYDSKTILRESGFTEMPIKVGRFRKLAYELYGRSPGIDALPDILEEESLRESVIVGTEKALNMPQGVFHDGITGGGVVDTSARAITVFKTPADGSSRLPIFEIGSPPNLNTAEARLQALKDTIAQHFYIDRLLDFNNQSQMTFGEAQIRNQIRNASLAMVYGRQLSEVFTPLVERCVNIKFEDGDFGVVPKSEKEQERLAAGKEVKNLPPELVERLEQDKPIYQVRYKTQAANAARSEEYMAILDVLSFGIQAMNVDPSVRHRVDLHRGVEEIARIRSVPAGVIRANDVVEELMKEEKAQQQGQQDMQMAVSGADVVQKMASATQTARM